MKVTSARFLRVLYKITSNYRAFIDLRLSLNLYLLTYRSKHLYKEVSYIVENMWGMKFNACFTNFYNKSQIHFSSEQFAKYK